MEYAKFLNGNTYDVRVVQNENDAQELLDKGYLPIQDLNTLPREELYTSKFFSLELNEENNVYEKTWHTNIGEILYKQIAILKQQLADTDYKVVKNMEYQMAMMATSETNQIILDLYDPKELHDERQALRDKINELEQLLKE